MMYGETFKGRHTAQHLTSKPSNRENNNEGLAPIHREYLFDKGVEDNSYPRFDKRVDHRNGDIPGIISETRIDIKS